MSSQWLSITRRARVGSPVEDGVEEQPVLAVEWSMFFSSTGIALSMSCRSACTAVTERTVSGGPGDGGDREVEARVGLPVAGGVGGAGDLVVRGDQEVALGRVQVEAGGDVAGARLDDPAEDQHVAQLLAARHQRTGRRRRGRLLGAVADDRAAPATAGRLDERGGAERGDRLAQGGAGDPQPLGQLALGRQRAAPGVDAQPDRGAPAARHSPRTRGARAPRAAPTRSARCWTWPTSRQSRDTGATASMV